MADKKMYKVGITVKEPWSADISYEVLDITLYAVENGGDGCSYIAIRANQGVTPGTDDTVWVKATQRGQSIYDLAVKYGDFEGTEAEFEAEYEAALHAAQSAAQNASEIEAQVETNEAARVTAERARSDAETARSSAETARINAENARNDAESLRDTAESDRVRAEAGRVTAEASRVEAETFRQGAEQSRRQQFEGLKADMETAIDNVDAKSAEIAEDIEGYEANEAGRVSAENARATAESARVSAESSRVSAESARAAAETERQTAEGNRATAETERSSAEVARTTAEQGRVSAEQGRVSAESDRVSAESARVAAETARESASATAVQNAETATAAANTAAEHAEEAATTIDDKIAEKADKSEVSQLGQEVSAELSQLSAVPSDFPNIRQNRTFSLYNITDQGKYAATSNAATIRYACEPNRLYKIVNPSGKRLVVGSSPTIVAANDTFENYKVSADNEHLEFTTGPSDVYLYVCYWAQASSAKTAGDALDDLSVTWQTAKDQYSRDKIDAAYNGAVKKSRNLYDPTRHWYEGMNMQNAGQIVGTYDNRGVVFLPVHGLSKITITLLASGVTATGCRYCWYDNNRAAIGGAVGNIPVYGEENASVLEVPETAYFIGFLVYYAGVQRDSNGAPLCMVEEGEGYTGYVPYGGTQVDISVNRPKDIYVCAKNSAKKYRQGCDYCCDGVNDELTIQAALDAVGTEGTLYLAPGIYYINSFPQQNDGQYCAIQYRLATGGSPERRVKIKAFDQTPMRQNGYSQLRRCATLKVGQAAYNALDSNTQYSVIGVETSNGERVWNGNIFDIEGVAIEIYGNQKQVIAFDAYYAFCIMMFKCMATAIPTNAVPATPGVDNCIGIRCTKGSNFGQESQINTCAMYGFGQGIAVSGEHYVITNAKTIYNKYGFTFNWFGSTDGGYSHPNTLINCCSEMDMNYPYFGQNTQNQSLTLIDFNMEHRTGVFAMGGNLATELVPGSWRGTIHYTIKVYGTDGYSITGNSPNMPFWADGHGANMQTINDAEPVSRSYSKVVNATGLKGKKVVCFGDSFTNYTDASNLHYTDYLERITGATMINCGIPGARLHARAAAVLVPQNDTEANAALDIINVVRASLGVDFDGTNTYKDVIRAASDYRGVYGAIVTRINSIDWSQIDGVIIQGGTNDWTNTALENTVAAINSIIELLLTNQPHLHIWWFTPTIRWDDYSGAASDVAGFSDVKQINGKTLKEFSAGIEAAVMDNHIPVCDLYNTLGWTKYNFSNYFPDGDGVHPRKAFDKYAYRIASFIASVKS